MGREIAKTNWVLCVLFIASVSLLVVYLTVQGNYFPALEDETIYYNSARLFEQTSSCKADCAIDERRSIIGNFNWYGPFYHLFYGGVAKIFGFAPVMFLWVNLVLLVTIVVQIFSIPIEAKSKIAFFVTLACSPVFVPYLFTFFPELIHISASIALIHIFLKVRTSGRVLDFGIAVILFSCLRYSFLIWSVGVFFFQKEQVSFKKKCILFVSMCLFGFLYFTYFTAVPNVQSLSVLHIGRESFIDINSIRLLIDNLVENIQRLFTITRIGVIYFFALFLSNSFFFVKSRFFSEDAVSRGLYVISFLSVFGFLVFYTTVPVYFEKQIIFLIPVQMIILLRNLVIKKIYFIVCSFVTLVSSVLLIRIHILARQQAYDFSKINSVYVNEFRNCFSGIDVKNDKEIEVLFHYKEFDRPTWLTLSSLPMSYKGSPVTYTTNLGTENTNCRFYLLGKYKIDFIISKHRLQAEKLYLVKETPFFYLYKLGEGYNTRTL